MSGCMLSLTYKNGFRLQGFLLCLENDSIRVALEDCEDAAEFRIVDGAWFAEEGDRVDIQLKPAVAHA